MPKYRKLPVEIEAVQVNEREPCPDWLGKAFSEETARPDHGTGAVLIDTLEGTMRADAGDWIIQGVNGEIYPCKPDIFAKTYEPADTPEALTAAMTDAILHGTGVTHIAFEDIVADSPDERPAGMPILPEGYSQNVETGMVLDMQGKAIGIPLGWRSPPISEDDPMHPVNRDAEFLKALTSVINCHSRENGRDTPDFILAQFVLGCLTAFDAAVSQRQWYKPPVMDRTGRL